MRAILITAFTLLCLAMTAAAQPLADRVPADSIVYVGWCGTDSLPAAYEQSHLKAIADSSRIRQAFSQLLPQVIQLVSSREPQVGAALGSAYEIAAAVWKHPTAFWFAGLDVSNPRRSIPRLGLMCKAGVDATAISTKVRNLLALNTRSPFQVFVQDDLVIVAAGYQQFEPFPPPVEGSLKQSVAFASAMKHVQADPVAIAFIDVERLAGMIESLAATDPQAGLIVPRAIDAMGLRGLKRIVCTSGFDGKDWLDQTFIEAPAPRTGLLELLDTRPISPELLKAIPADSAFAASTRFDPAAIIAKVRSSLGQIDPEAQAMFDKGLGAVQLALARNPLTDVLEPLGQDWAIYCSPSVAGNGILGFVVVNRLDDPAKAASSLPTVWINLNNWVAAALVRAQVRVQITGKTTRIDGVDVYYMGLPLLAPSWAIQDDYLYFSLFPQSTAAAANWTRTGQKSIVDNPGFIALQKRLGVSNPCSFSYYDLLASSQGSLYQQWLILARYAGFADLFGLTLPEPFLPPLNVLREHLSPAASMTWIDDAGYHSKTISPFPGAMMFSEPGIFSSIGPAIGGTTMAVLLPSLNRARETANRVKCATNMKQIGMGLLLYANENNNRLPLTPGELIKTVGLPVDVFVCPSSGTKIPHDIRSADAETQAAWADANSDYIYVGSGKAMDKLRPDAILLYEKPGNHSHNGMNMLFTDGHVEWSSQRSAERMIQQQQARP